MAIRFSSGRLLHTVVAGECGSVTVVVDDCVDSSIPPMVELATLAGHPVTLLRSADVEVSGDGSVTLSFELPDVAVDKAGFLHINVVDRRSGESVGRCLLLVTPAV